MATKELFTKCDYCNGDGFTSEHDNHPHMGGDCMGQCPIQVQCENCQGTGVIEISDSEFQQAYE